jgi:hypothetical protein
MARRRDAKDLGEDPARLMRTLVNGWVRTQQAGFVRLFAPGPLGHDRLSASPAE